MKPAERMRVIFVSPGGTQGRGGIQSMTRYMIERLSRRDGIECLVLDPYGVGSKWQMPFRFLSALVRLPFLAFRRPAVVHSNMSFGGSALRKLLLLRWGCLFGIPTVLHLHGSEFAVFCDRLPPFPRRMLIASMVRAARIVVIGTYWKNYLVEQLGIDPDKVLVIHNGVPMLRAASTPRSRRQVPHRIVRQTRTSKGNVGSPESARVTIGRAA